MRLRMVSLLVIACGAGVVATHPSHAQQPSAVTVEEIPGFSNDPSGGVNGPLTPQFLAAAVGADPTGIAALEEAFASGEISGYVRRLQNDQGAIAVLISLVLEGSGATDQFFAGLSSRTDISNVEPGNGVPDGVVAFEQAVDGGQLARTAAYKASETAVVLVTVLAPEVNEPFQIVLEAQLNHAPVHDVAVGTDSIEAVTDRENSAAYLAGRILVPIMLIIAVVLYLRFRKRTRANAADT